MTDETTIHGAVFHMTACMTGIYRPNNFAEDVSPADSMFVFATFDDALRNSDDKRRRHDMSFPRVTRPCKYTH